MATGKITIKENNLDLTVDYGVAPNHLNKTIDFGEGQDVPAQIQAIIDAALAEGVTITGIFTSRANLSKMRSHASVQQAINGNMGIGAQVRMSALIAWLEEEYGITQVVTNDLTYGYDTEIGADGRPSIKTHRYFPADKISFFASNPSGRLGIGLWGDPPEADAPTIDMPTKTSDVSPFVYISQWIEKDPKVLWTKASGLFMPVLYNPASLFVATATETSGEG